MWISKNISNIKNNNDIAYEGKITQSADRRVSVNATNGVEQFSLMAPPGIVYIPKKSENAVVLSTDMGKMCIGVRIPQNSFELEAGEIMLYSSGGATVILKNDGKVIINGKEF